MNPQSPNFYPGLPARLPRAVIAAAASALLLTSCTEAGTPEPGVTKTVTASASPSGETSSADASQTPDKDAETNAAPSTEESADRHGNDKQNENSSTDGNQQEKQPDNSSHAGTNPQKTTTPKPTPSATPTPKAKALEFYITGDCQKDGELVNWSKGFTPHGATRNLIMQPDGTAYQGLINGGQGNVDGLGHSEWAWPCDDKDQKGTYTGQIIDLGPDDTLNTADDRKKVYTFEVN